MLHCIITEKRMGMEYLKITFTIVINKFDFYSEKDSNYEDRTFITPPVRTSNPLGCLNSMGAQKLYFNTWYYYAGFQSPVWNTGVVYPNCFNAFPLLLSG
jgi:hypothetical protein